MPPALLSRDEVVERIMTVVRRHGYDGASLAELSKETGLGRSSLYHYFPDGKDDMIRAVLEHLETQLRAAIFDPLRESTSARRRIAGMARALDEYYDGGREACVLGNLVLGTSRTRFRVKLRAIFDEWIDALATALVDLGYSKAAARARAEDAVTRIEGALIVAGGMDDPSVFGRTIKRLTTDLLALPTATG